MTRKILFWIHLSAGLLAGIVVFIMSITGAAIAFEKEIVAKAEREVRQVRPSAPPASQLPIDELLERAQASQSGTRPSSVTVFADPQAAVSFTWGRTNVSYVNPYTGAVCASTAVRTRTFMRVMTDWHRWLGRDGEGRAVGKAITGACNVAFLFLALSGIFLWWPRRWSWAGLKGILLFNVKLRGKARDWNWHNVLGIWSAPVLVILTATAMIISYRWASDLVYKLAGSSPPPAGATVSSAPVEVATPPPGTRPVPYQTLVAAALKEIPHWEQITIRFSGSGQRAPSGGTPNSQRSERVSGERAPNRSESTARDESRSSAQSVSVAVRERSGWPLFANVQLMLDPFTGAVLKRESFADYSTGRKVRTWMRFLHTGEALGFFGQLLAALASLGAAVLVYTGFALACRRFIAWRRKPAAAIRVPDAGEELHTS